MRLIEWETELVRSVDYIEFETNPSNKSEYQNSEQTFAKYLDNSVEDYFENPEMANWPNEFENYYSASRGLLKGNVLELGAGSTKFSAMLSRKPGVKSVTCVEFARPMIREIAPRVFLHFQGDLTKARFVASDMHAVENFSFTKFDAIVFHSALHHVFLPFEQIKKLTNVLAPGGTIFGFSEPCTSRIQLPTKSNMDWVLGQMRHQLGGNNENYYRAQDYRDFFIKFLDFDFEYLLARPSANKLTRFLRSTGVDRLVWPRPLSISFRATLNF